MLKINYLIDSKGKYMKSISTIFLRIAIVAVGLIALAFCVLLLPVIYREWNSEFPDMAYVRYPLILGLSATAIAFWSALYQAMKLLKLIDKNQAFSLASVKALEKVKYYTAIIGILYAIAMPLFYYLAELDDAPGLILIGMIFTGAPVVVAVFAGVVQRLFQNAIDLKSENDLTV